MFEPICPDDDEYDEFDQVDAVLTAFMGIAVTAAFLMSPNASAIIKATGEAWGRADG